MNQKLKQSIGRIRELKKMDEIIKRLVWANYEANGGDYEKAKDQAFERLYSEYPDVLAVYLSQF
jgi:hypothetical protein